MKYSSIRKWKICIRRDRVVIQSWSLEFMSVLHVILEMQCNRLDLKELTIVNPAY